jgi:hypothetical protein
MTKKEAKIRKLEVELQIMGNLFAVGESYTTILNENRQMIKDELIKLKGYGKML